MATILGDENFEFKQDLDKDGHHPIIPAKDAGWVVLSRPNHGIVFLFFLSTLNFLDVFLIYIC